MSWINPKADGYLLPSFVLQRYCDIVDATGHDLPTQAAKAVWEDHALWHLAGIRSGCCPDA